MSGKWIPTLEWAVEDLNRVLRGWGNYFRYSNSARKFAQIDSYVNERLAILASAKHGLQGRNWVTRFNLRVVDPARHLSPDRNGETHARVCQPLNDVGEPCAGEPHARFDAAAGGASRQSAAPCGAGRLPPTLHRGSEPHPRRCVRECPYLRGTPGARRASSGSRCGSENGGVQCQGGAWLRGRSRGP